MGFWLEVKMKIQERGPRPGRRAAWIGARRFALWNQRSAGEVADRPHQRV